jgi:hypothetical protein
MTCNLTLTAGSGSKLSDAPKKAAPCPQSRSSWVRRFSGDTQLILQIILQWRGATQDDFSCIALYGGGVPGEILYQRETSGQLVWLDVDLFTSPGTRSGRKGW